MKSIKGHFRSHDTAMLGPSTSNEEEVLKIMTIWLKDYVVNCLKGEGVEIGDNPRFDNVLARCVSEATRELMLFIEERSKE